MILVHMQTLRRRRGVRHLRILGQEQGYAVSGLQAAPVRLQRRQHPANVARRSAGYSQSTFFLNTFFFVFF